MHKFILVSLFSLLLGASAALGFFLFYFSLPVKIWYPAAIAALSIVGILFVFLHKEAPKPLPFEEIQHLKNETQRYNREFKQAIRGQLKISILFWIHIYRKDKAKSFEDAKKEVFQDLKKEFPHLRWMQSLIEDIRQEFAKRDL